ncbi:MAG: hypothetical protein AB9856_00920 [Cellulosilyticaceae bacterium]
MEIYSLNYIAFLKANDYPVTLFKMENQVIGYVELSDQLDKLRDEYKTNQFWHKLSSAYGDIKKMKHPLNR